MLKKYIGNKEFYRMALTVALPMMIQNAVTNFVSLLDNIMVGRVGTLQMTGVSVVNQLLFVYNLCVFGAVAGAGIFTAQFYGQKGDEGMRQHFRFKIFIIKIHFWSPPNAYLSCKTKQGGEDLCPTTCKNFSIQLL